MERLYTIQYLRALAALAVVALHAGNRVDLALPTGIFAALFLGHAGVDLFFVISGFIMWTIGRSTSGGAAEFLLRRFVRVAPPYWIATGAWVTVSWVAGYQWVVITPDHVIFSLLFVPHFSPTFPDQIWPVLIPGWTLTYEVFFYALLATTLLVAARSRLVLIACVLAGLVGLGGVVAPDGAWSITLTSPLLIEFLGGCLVAELFTRQPGGMARNVVLVLSGFALLVWSGHGVDHQSHFDRTIGFGGPAVLIVAGAAGLARHVPRFVLLERLGDASYAIYLFHLFILTPMAGVWKLLPGMHNSMTAVLFVCSALILSSALGLMIYRFLELPLQRWLTRSLIARPWRHALVRH